MASNFEELLLGISFKNYFNARVCANNIHNIQHVFSTIF